VAERCLPNGKGPGSFSLDNFSARIGLISGSARQDSGSSWTCRMRYGNHCDLLLLLSILFSPGLSVVCPIPHFNHLCYKREEYSSSGPAG
jgi:hypothetical protein